MPTDRISCRWTQPVPAPDSMYAGVPSTMPADVTAIVGASSIASTVLRIVSRLCQTKVQNLHPAVGRDLDIGGLDIPVCDASLMRCAQRVGELAADAHRLVEGHAAAGDPLGQRVTGDELHDEIQGTVGFLEPVNRCDVRMIQRREQLRFPAKALDTILIVREGLRQNLDGDIAPEVLIPGGVDLAHPSRAEQAQDSVGPIVVPVSDCRGTCGRSALLYRIRLPNADRASSVANSAVVFRMSSVGLTSTKSSATSRCESATSSITMCASR